MKLTDEQAAAVKAWQGLEEWERMTAQAALACCREVHSDPVERQYFDKALAVLEALASPAAEPVSAAYKSESLQKTQQLPCATCGETGFMRLSSEPMSIPWPGPDSPAPSCATCKREVMQNVATEHLCIDCKLVALETEAFRLRAALEHIANDGGTQRLYLADVPQFARNVIEGIK